MNFVKLELVNLYSECNPKPPYLDSKTLLEGLRGAKNEC